jgi:hypothetical protein
MQHQPKDANDALRMPVPGLIPGLLRNARPATSHVDVAPQFWPAQQQQEKDVHRRNSKVGTAPSAPAEESAKLGISSVPFPIASVPTPLPAATTPAEVQYHLHD